MEPVIERIRERLVADDPGGVLALYLYGSAVTGGLQPQSDLDLLLVTSRSLTLDERRHLLEVLLRHSGSGAVVEPARALELTSIVLDDVVPWTYPAVLDFQFGEWLLDEYAAGLVPDRHADPDLAVLLTTLRQHSQPLIGVPAADLLDAVPAADLRRATFDGLNQLLGDLEGDERNVLLTLARMIVTLETGAIVPKDDAAAFVVQRLDEPGRSLLALAAAAYRGEVSDDWSGRRQAAREAADQLAGQIGKHRD